MTGNVEGNRLCVGSKIGVPCAGTLVKGSDRCRVHDQGWVETRVGKPVSLEFLGGASISGEELVSIIGEYSASGASSVVLGLSSRGAVFAPEMSFAAVVFNGRCNFDGSTFLGDVSFARAQFAGDVSFAGCNFGGDTDFAGAVFEGGGTFEGSQFCGSLSLARVAVVHPLDLRWCRFLGELRLGDTPSSKVRLDGVRPLGLRANPV